MVWLTRFRSPELITDVFHHSGTMCRSSEDWKKVMCHFRWFLWLRRVRLLPVPCVCWWRGGACVRHRCVPLCATVFQGLFAFIAHLRIFFPPIIQLQPKEETRLSTRCWWSSPSSPSSCVSPWSYRNTSKSSWSMFDRQILHWIAEYSLSNVSQWN